VLSPSGSLMLATLPNTSAQEIPTFYSNFHHIENFLTQHFDVLMVHKFSERCE